MSGLLDLVKQVNDMKQQIKDSGEAAFYKEIKEILDRHPQVLAIHWTQYTPYFNDGEPCEFSVNEPTILFNSKTPDIGWGEHPYRFDINYKDLLPSVDFNEEDMEDEDYVVESFKDYWIDGGTLYSAKMYISDPEYRGEWDNRKSEKYDEFHSGRREHFESNAGHWYRSNKEAVDDVVDLTRGISGLPGVAKDIFGDHVLVFITRKGIEITEYDHD